MPSHQPANMHIIQSQRLFGDIRDLPHVILAGYKKVVQLTVIDANFHLEAFIFGDKKRTQAGAHLVCIFVSKVYVVNHLIKFNNFSEQRHHFSLFKQNGDRKVFNEYKQIIRDEFSKFKRFKVWRTSLVSWYFFNTQNISFLAAKIQTIPRPHANNDLNATYTHSHSMFLKTIFVKTKTTGKKWTENRWPF